MSVTAERDSVTVTAPSVTNGVTLERDTLARARALLRRDVTLSRVTHGA